MRRISKDAALAKCLTALCNMMPQLGGGIVRHDIIKDFLEGANAFAVACQAESKRTPKPRGRGRK